jgi:hypothetical protein
VAYKRQYETPEKQIKEFPLIESRPPKIELEDGRLADDTDPLVHPTLGSLKHIKDIWVPDAPPEPHSPARADAIRLFHVALNRFPTDHQANFLKKNPRLTSAFEQDFLGVPREKIEEYADLLDREREQILEDQQRSEPAPTFDQYQLTRNFYFSRFNYGDFVITGRREYGTAVNGWRDASWWIRCKCEKDSPTPTRWVSAQMLLQIESGDPRWPRWTCGNPCR